ncbi:alpha/beta hydrolase [Gordonia sp. HY002]|uniref:alpha/beta fold hydrolase n=1 Tax=Gordonia zhenghanii TaxID=2911516 RepID=UPI001F3F53D9|nr:alpha/beta hydrolase [Gordonia zhenghanii]MCF8569562.1 alpha/beta hydrolase [Gordonia zhenghanii]
METEHLTIDHDGLSFDVHLSGPARGPVAVLLHGFPVDSRCWDDVIPRLHDSGLRTVAIDQRGYSPGARPEGVDAYTLDKLTGDVLAILGHLNIAYSMVVGHDWGGIVAWHLAANNPDRFTSLVAVSTGHPSAMRDALMAGDQRDRSTYIKWFVEPDAEDRLTADGGASLRTFGVSAAEIEPLLEPGALTGPLNWYRANFTGDIATKLACPPVEIPTTMVWSDADDALGREQAELSGRYAYGDYRFSVIAGVDHWVPQNAAPAVASEVSLRSSLF